MKLAEALLERKSLNEKILSLRQRLHENVLVQEGDQPGEHPGILLGELEAAIEQLGIITKQINATNNITRLKDGSTISEAIVKRDTLKLKRNAIHQTVEAASLRNHRYGRNEVKFVLTVNVPDLQKLVDDVSRQWRMLDAEIQAMNWDAELQV